ncbi:MAG: NAD-dependent epimerase [Ignavibacteria bacterium]|jgi:UDP-glucuronate 4-epimerase
MKRKILVTGSAGFIGFHLVNELLLNGLEVVGIDNINDYYDINLKLGRLNDAGINTDQINYNEKNTSSTNEAYTFVKLDINDRDNLESLFETEKFNIVINVAAQPGVRYSLVNPYAYADSNLSGFLNILENCRNYNIEHLVFASSSSVYGLNETIPYSIKDNIDHPISLYAATKKANELMAHSYSHLFRIPVTGLRFFTVYGEWGRPDMAYYLFTKAIYEGSEIKVFNGGNMERDFTYIDDIVKGVVKVVECPAKENSQWSGKTPDPSSSSAPFRLYNIGNSKPVKLMDFIEEIENSVGKKALKKYLPMQPGDVVRTWADVSELERDFGYKPDTPLNVGITKFINWFKEFHNIQ